MRMNIHQLKILEKTVRAQVIYLFILSLIYAILFGVSSEFLDRFIGFNDERFKNTSLFQRILIGSFNGMWLILLWNMIYYIYHHDKRTKKQQIDTLRLEALVKSLELQTIKSHINPHFIFNALNSIRALVDENPKRARTAITELSNILRSSMQIEKLETVPLQHELDIVRDYLALEKIRFEERLIIHMDIDENTLELPIPPMMLQTLVENAIKHGISKQINGGVIEISSKIIYNEHHLIVRNSGRLNGYNVHTDRGFGLKSTYDRLSLLYQGRADFQIREVGQNTVESKIIMPL